MTATLVKLSELMELRYASSISKRIHAKELLVTIRPIKDDLCCWSGDFASMDIKPPPEELTDQALHRDATPGENQTCTENSKDNDVKAETNEEVSLPTSEQENDKDVTILVAAGEDDHLEVGKASEVPRPLSNDSGVGTSCSESDIMPSSPVNVSSTAPSMVTDSPSEGAIVSVSVPQTNSNSGTATLPTTQPQPTRRRPGRPPGSTKKYRQAAMANVDSSGSVFRRGTDFTLRKFFEAGGRDYNEYLEWLKRRDNGENVPFLNSPSGPGGNQPNQTPHIGSGPMPLVPYPPVPYMQRPMVTMPSSGPLPGVYRPLSGQPMGGPVRVPAMPYYPVPQQPHTSPQHPTKRTTEEVLDLSAKKSRLDPNGNLIGVGSKTPCQLTGDLTSPRRLSDGEAGCVSPTRPPANHPMTSWDVEKVACFVAGVPGCNDYVEVFREQKIDGATLPHLSEEHLLNIVKMKLGPAIRLRLEVQKLTQVT